MCLWVQEEAKVARMVLQKMGSWWASGRAQPGTCLSPASVMSVRTQGVTPSLLPSADQALDRFAMKKYYDDKVSALMQPSQKRYVSRPEGTAMRADRCNFRQRAPERPGAGGRAVPLLTWGL